MTPAALARRVVKWIVMLVLAVIACFVALIVIWLGFGRDYADSAWYPGIEQAIEESAPERRDAMLRSWASHTGPSGLIGRSGLKEFLAEFGYCTGARDHVGCKPLPAGTEAQGIAKDWLQSMSENLQRRDQRGSEVPTCTIRTIPHDVQWQMARGGVQ